jgi:hypothetical protein
MRGFLRSVIVAARRSDTLLKPLVPSLYADRGVRAQDAGGNQQRVDDAAPNGRGRLAMPSAPASSNAPAEPDDGARYDHTRSESMHGPDDESAGPAMSDTRGDAVREVLQPPLMQGPVPAAVPRLATAHVAEHRARGALTIAPSASDTADSSTAPSRARVARPANARNSPADAETVAGSDRDSAAYSRVQPLLLEQSVASESPGRAAPNSKGTHEFANRTGRTTADLRPPSGNDVEIHIGRIEVTAAPPVVRAPPKSAPPSPSLSDYLNGRRGRRT